MKININKSIERTYKNEIWKGFTLKEVGCAIGALSAIGLIAFLSYRFLHLSFSIGVYIGIPFAFPFVLLGFKKFSGMTLLNYLKVRKARKESGILIKDDNLPIDLPRTPFRMDIDLSVGEEKGFLYEFDKREWSSVRKKDFLYRLTHGHPETFGQYEYKDPELPKPPTEEFLELTGPTVLTEQMDSEGCAAVEDVPPGGTKQTQSEPKDERVERPKKNFLVYLLLAIIILLIGAFVALHFTGALSIHLRQNKKQEKPVETMTPETVTETQTTTIVKSSDVGLNSLKIDEHPLDVEASSQEYEVENTVSKITVYAEPHDSKTTLTGTGEYDLNVGTNTVELTITAEDGSTRKIVLTIKRKDPETTTAAPPPPAPAYNYNNNNYYEPPAPQEPTVAPNNGVTIIG